jgi:hypothetical protein
LKKHLNKTMDMIFGEGPILTGNWYNPKTGDSFTVRDTYFEDNNFYIMTTDGRRLNYDIVSQYIQSDKPIPKMEQPQPKTQIPQEILSQMESGVEDDFMTDEDKALIFGGTIQPQPTDTLSFNAQEKPNFSGPVTLGQGESEDDMLVRRILKRASKPAVTCGVKWSNFPEKQFEMLDMMSIDTEKIIDYFLQSIDLEALREEVKLGIEKYIYDYFGNEKEIAEFNESFEPEVVEKEPVEKPKTTKKPTTKKTTKKK